MLVDTDGDLNKLTTILVANIDAVLARVFRSDFVDDETGKLSTVESYFGVLIRGNFLLIFEPGHLRGWFAPHSAGQA